MSKRKDVAAAPERAEGGSYEIQAPKRGRVGFEVRGRSYIQNAFSQKAIEEMLKKHMGLSVQREKKVPREVIERAIIRNVDGVVCAPPVAIKSAMLTASGQIKKFIPKTQLRTVLFVEGESVPISFEKMIPRLDMVRTSGIGRTPDVRFRPNFVGWSARFIVEYSDSLLNQQTIVDLVNRAGSVGIGEWRPERNGTHGTFEIARVIDTAREAAEVEAQCKVPLITPAIPDWAIDANIDMTLLAKIFSPGGDGDGEEVEEEDRPKPSKSARRA